MNCLTCEYARRAENNEYVGCIKFTESSQKENYTDANFLCEFYGRRSICLGWVNLAKRPEDLAKTGMITNGIPCFKKEDSCKHYKARF